MRRVDQWSKLVFQFNAQFFNLKIIYWWPVYALYIFVIFSCCYRVETWKELHFYQAVNLSPSSLRGREKRSISSSHFSKLYFGLSNNVLFVIEFFWKIVKIIKKCFSFSSSETVSYRFWARGGVKLWKTLVLLS